MRLKTIDYILVGAQGVLFLFYVLPYSIDSNIKLSGPFLWPALLTILLGIVEILWALWQLGRFLSPFPKPKQNARLITSGIFSWVRHPIYSGIILSAVGLGLYLQDVYKVLISLILLLFFYFKSQYEERNMLAQFPEYEAYKKRVGRFFPGLFPTKPK